MNPVSASQMAPSLRLAHADWKEEILRHILQGSDQEITKKLDWLLFKPFKDPISFTFFKSTERRTIKIGVVNRSSNLSEIIIKLRHNNPEC